MRFNPFSSRDSSFRGDRRDLTTPEQREKIALIEKAPLGSWDKASLVLLILDKKQVVHIGDSFENENQQESVNLRARLQTKVESILSLATRLGLEVNNSGVQTSQIEDTPVLTFNVLLAKNRDPIEQYKTAEGSSDEITMGLLHGYPETAVKWFAANSKTVNVSEINQIILDLMNEGLQGEDIQKRFAEKFPFLDQPAGSREVIEREQLGQFKHFKLSPDHWREELDAVRQIKETIRLNAPNLYSELMKSSKTEKTT
jgi:hypothetical protein